MTTDVVAAPMSIKIPVYYVVPHGVLTITKVGTIKGKMLQSEPTMVSSFLYDQFGDRLLIAPMTREYLTQLFGSRYFSSTKFEFDYLHEMSKDFLDKLASKVGVDVSRTYTRKGKARKIVARIKKEMGIGS